MLQHVVDDGQLPRKSGGDIRYPAGGIQVELAAGVHQENALVRPIDVRCPCRQLPVTRAAGVDGDGHHFSFVEKVDRVGQALHRLPSREAVLTKHSTQLPLGELTLNVTLHRQELIPQRREAPSWG